MVKLYRKTEAMHPYKRKVTHTQYRHGDKEVKKGGWSRMLQMRISENSYELTKEDVSTKGNISEANDKYMSGVGSANVSAYWGGGVFLLLFIISVLIEFGYPEEKTTKGFIIAMIAFFLGFVFFSCLLFNNAKEGENF